MRVKDLPLLFLLVCFMAGFARADAIVDWNAVIHQTNALNVPGRPPTAGTRIFAMTHIAIHDALNAIDPRYEYYAYAGPGDPNASAAAAVAAAAYNVLRLENPNLPGAPNTVLFIAYTNALAAIPDGPEKTAGIAIGEAAAAAIRALRADDGSADPCPPWINGTQPGEWRPTGSGNFVTPCWGDVAPFTMNAGDRWRVPTRPALSLTNALYTRDFLEVKEYGGTASTSRTTDQSEAARFWYPNPPLTWHRIADLVGMQRGVDLWENARLYALMSTAEADALIAVWDSKRAFPFWRPVTAINEAEHDGNPATEDDDSWTSYMVTPPYPDYNSGHAGVDGSSAEVLARFFGTDSAGFSLSTTLGAGPPVMRTFTSFSGAAKDGADSRIWGGIHFRTACEDSLKQGHRIGRQAFNHYLRPLDEL